MSAHNLPYEFEQIDIGDGTVERFLGNPNTNGKVFAVSNTVPSDGATGYAHGCVHLHLDGGGSNPLRVNIGTKASANFDVIVHQGPVPAIPEADANETDPANNSVIINLILAVLADRGMITIAT